VPISGQHPRASVAKREVRRIFLASPDWHPEGPRLAPPQAAQQGVVLIGCPANCSGDAEWGYPLGLIQMCTTSHADQRPFCGHDEESEATS